MGIDPFTKNEFDIYVETQEEQRDCCQVGRKLNFSQRKFLHSPPCIMTFQLKERRLLSHQISLRNSWAHASIFRTKKELLTEIVTAALE